jgi:hypothetical protein
MKVINGAKLKYDGSPKKVQLSGVTPSEMK